MEDTLTIVSSILEDLITQITETEKKQKRKKKKKHREPHMGMAHFLRYLKGEDDSDENSLPKNTEGVNTNLTVDVDAEVRLFTRCLFSFCVC